MDKKLEANGLSKNMNSIINYKNSDKTDHSKISCSTYMASHIDHNINLSLTDSKSYSESSNTVKRNLNLIFKEDQSLENPKSEYDKSNFDLITNTLKLNEERPSMNLGESRRLINNIQVTSKRFAELQINESDRRSIYLPDDISQTSDNQSGFEDQLEELDEFPIEESEFPDEMKDNEAFKLKYCKEKQLKLGKSAYKSASKVDSILKFVKRKSEIPFESLMMPILADRKIHKTDIKEKTRNNQKSKPKEAKAEKVIFKVKPHSLKKTFQGLFKLIDFNGKALYYRCFRDSDIGIKEKWQIQRIEATIDEDVPFFFDTYIRVSITPIIYSFAIKVNKFK